MELTQLEQMFNDDVKRLFYSFSYPGHREFIRGLTNILAVDDSPFVERFNEKRQGRGLYKYLMEEYSLQELIFWTNYFARCHCCTRHCHGKPRFVTSTMVLPPETMWKKRVVTQGLVKSERTPTPAEYGCPCKCRQIARHCVRAYHRDWDIV